MPLGGEVVVAVNRSGAVAPAIMQAKRPDTYTLTKKTRPVHLVAKLFWWCVPLSPSSSLLSMAHFARSRRAYTLRVCSSCCPICSTIYVPGYFGSTYMLYDFFENKKKCASRSNLRRSPLLIIYRQPPYMAVDGSLHLDGQQSRNQKY